MTLRELLIENKEQVVQAWRQRIIATYPQDGREFLSGSGDPFTNPIGQVIHDETDRLFDQLLNGMDSDATRASLDKLIRIRAVQEFSPSEAVSFVIQLKPLIRDLLSVDIVPPSLHDDLHDTEDTIDRMQLLALDAYTACRDRISQIKVNDARRSTAKLIERLNARLAQSAGHGQDNDDEDNDR